MINIIFESIFNEAKIDRIAKFSNLTDEQKEEAKSFYKSHATGYDQYIDWQHPEKVTWDDFQKAIDASKESKSQKQKLRGEKIRAAQKNEWETFFDRDDVIIQGQNDDWIFVSPLSWKACEWMDSVDCGGGKAGWCIGWEKSDSHWKGYVSMGNSFVMAFRKDFKEHEADSDIKYMIRYNEFCDNEDDPFYYYFDSPVGDIWDQPDNNVGDIIPYDDDEIDRRFELTKPMLREMSAKFWEKLFIVNPEMGELLPSIQEGHGAVKYDVFRDSEFLDDWDLTGKVLEKVNENYSQEIVEKLHDYIEETCRDNEYDWSPICTWDAEAKSHKTLKDLVDNYSSWGELAYQENSKRFEEVVNDTFEEVSKECNKLEANLDVMPTFEKLDVLGTIKNNVKGFISLDTKQYTYERLESIDFGNFEYDFDDGPAIDLLFEKSIIDTTFTPIIDYNDLIKIDGKKFVATQSSPLSIKFKYYITNIPSDFNIQDLYSNKKCIGIIDSKATSVTFIGQPFGNIINCQFDFLKTEGTCSLYDSIINVMDARTESSDIYHCNIQSFASSVNEFTEESNFYGLATIRNSKISGNVLPTNSVIVDKASIDYIKSINVSEDNGPRKIGIVLGTDLHQITWLNVEGLNMVEVAGKSVDIHSPNFIGALNSKIEESLEDIYRLSKA